MPARLIPLISGQIYHLFNRGIDRRPTFVDKFELTRAVALTDYYRFASPKLKFSRFLLLPQDERKAILNKLKGENNSLVEILSFCFMPNHFHFLLRQVADGGISKFLSNFQNSYTRYFNTKNDRDGALFLGQFKSVHIETDEQLVHISRYIHLNPTTSYVVKDFDGLINYRWSSLPQYINVHSDICETKTILDFFKDPVSYLKFVEDNMSYQRELDKIKHLTLE